MRPLSVRPLVAGLFVLTCVLAGLSVPLSAGLEAAYDTVFYPLNAVVLGLAGTLIVWRQGRHPIGWLLCGMGIDAAFAEFVEGYSYHSSYPAAVPSQWLTSWDSYLGIGATAIVVMLFPSGRMLSRRWRPVLWIGIAGPVLMIVGTALGPEGDASFGSGSNPYAVEGPVMPAIYAAGQALFMVALLAAVAALAVRFRRSRGIERQQLKWVAYAVSLLAVTGPFAIVAYQDSELVRVAIAVVVLLLPAAICVAILRYRLYDIDVIINRTLVYGALTGLLAAVYLAVVLVLGSVLGGGRSPWVTAAATLAAATLFLPLRRRIQDGVDRRFRPARYDALARVDAFLEDLRAGRVAAERLEQVLREALDAPELELQFVLPDGHTHIDVRGLAVRASQDERVQTLVERAGVLLAVVIHGSAPGTETDLLTSVLDRAGLAIEIARLQAEVNRQLAEVQASRARIVAAGYEERRRLERDLHDGAQQRLVSVGLSLRHAQHELGPSPVSRNLEEAVAQISGAISDLRELANGVRPAYLDNGLDVALRELAGRTTLPVLVRVGAERFPPDVEATAYFVACEALTNAVKHSAATQVEVRAEHSGHRLVLTVQDDGVGGAQPGRGSGLRGLSDRVTAQGGQIDVDSRAGAGTTLTVRLPCGC